jgi:pilus assembly protein Flp/PilA
MKANFLRIVRNLHNDESGQDLIEYALVASLIALAAVAAIQGVGTQVNTIFSNISATLSKYA